MKLIRISRGSWVNPNDVRGVGYEFERKGADGVF